MQLRTRLTIIFTLIAGLILFICSITIYVFSARYRADEFEERLHKKLTATARLYADIDEVDARLLRIIQQQELGILPNEQITVHSLRGKELYRSDEIHYFDVQPQFLLQVKQNGEHFEQVGMFEVYGRIYSGKSGTFIFVAGGYDKFGFSKQRNLRHILVVVTLGGILILALGGWIYAGRALKPIDSLIGQASAMTPEKLNVRLEVGETQDELSRLARVFNQLFDRIEVAFKAQKTFVANASHELRTPLTIISGQLEVLLMKERTNAEYKVSAESILEDIRRLNTISNRLLLLAQTEKSPEELPASEVRLDELLWSVKSELRKSKPNYRINIRFLGVDDLNETMSVWGNAQLLETAFLNLADNACKFSKDNSCDVELEFAEHQVFLRFRDNGIGILPQEMEFLFQPFFRSSKAVQFPGHGLGLAMVKKIIDVHRGELSVESRANEGTTFLVNLKRKFR
jgi:signal transduction histidine kinase